MYGSSSLKLSYFALHPEAPFKKGFLLMLHHNQHYKFIINTDYQLILLKTIIKNHGCNNDLALLERKMSSKLHNK